MSRDEFFLLVCDGETLDTDEVMAEYDRLTAELAAANERLMTYAVSVCPELDATIAELQAQLTASKAEKLRWELLAIDRRIELSTVNAEIESLKAKNKKYLSALDEIASFNDEKLIGTLFGKPIIENNILAKIAKTALEAK